MSFPIAYPCAGPSPRAIRNVKCQIGQRPAYVIASHACFDETAGIKGLYPRFESLLRRLRGALEEAGIDRDITLEVISRRDVDISLALLEDARHVPGPDRDAPATAV